MTDDTIERLQRLDACAVSDTMDALNLPPGISGIRRHAGAGVLAGRVVTVTLCEGPPPTDVPKVHLCARAISVADHNSVIVIAHPGIDAGGWGGVLSQAASVRNIRGVVLDGPSRDIDEAAGLGFNVFCRSTTPRTARGRVHEAATNEPVSIGDVEVNPGDFVIADGSGVVFIAQQQISAVLHKAEQIAEKERAMVEALHAGHPATEIMGSNYEDMLRLSDQG